MSDNTNGTPAFLRPDPEASVVRISGRLSFSDGTFHEFYIDSDGGWQQWGATHGALGRSTELLNALAQAGMEEGTLRGESNE